jgi:hypothetical protein
MFAQLMRYSILSSVVDDVDERNRFFDNGRLEKFHGPAVIG